jgi:phosphohistidine phosphatase
MRLYFLRHGLAADREDWPAEEDFARPLTARGQDQLKRTAETLAALDLRLDVILTSPLTRALQTAEIVAKRLDMLDRLVPDQRLSPGFEVGQLSAILQAHPGAANLMLVGHEPDFSQTISALIGGGTIVCKKGGLARVDVPSGTQLAGELVWLIPPSVLVLSSGE